MDPLSEVIALLKPRSYVSSGFDAGGDWSLRFNINNDIIKCYAVVSGSCWMDVDGVERPLRLNAGDCFVLPSGRPFRLASDMGLRPADAKTAFPPASPGGIVTINGGGGLFLVGSRFAVAGAHAGLLLRMLPPMVHIPSKTEQSALRWSVERMREELAGGEPGSYLIAQHLAQMMLVQALRLHLANSAGGVPGWFTALADAQIGAAIHAMHASPARRWTLPDLAAHVGMSRSVFAQRFREKAGEPPMEYLARWRMLLAADRLANSGDPISKIAPSLGYESESAFATAFKRVMGCPPRQYDIVRRNGADPTGRRFIAARGAMSGAERGA